MSVIIKLPGEKLWVELSDTNEFIALHSRPQITADIQAIRNTLLQYPSPTQDAADVADVLAAIAAKWTEAKRARIVALVNSMYQAYQGDARVLEAAALLVRLEALTTLRERLI